MNTAKTTEIRTNILPGTLLRDEYAMSVRPAISNSRVVNPFPSFVMIWITSSSTICSLPVRLNFFKCWQLSAIRRTVFPLNPCWKKTPLLFTLNKSVFIFALISRYYTHNFIKLNHNEDVFYKHFPFCLIYL